MDNEPFQSKSNSDQESEDYNRENDNKSLNLNKYCGVNEFCREDSRKTKEDTNNIQYDLNDPFNIDSDEDFSDFSDKMNFSLLNRKRQNENNNLEKYNLSENKQGEINFENKEDFLSSLKNFENNRNIEEEGESSENNKENDNDERKQKEDEKKIVFKISKTNREEEKKFTKMGRKKQIDKDQGKNGLHTREDKDNKIRKIKSYFGKDIYNFINKSFNDKSKEFMKLEININKNLKKDFNEDLFKKKLKDIYSENEISNKYVHYEKDINKKLIDKIYEEQKETAVIKILNLTYIEAFDIFRRKIKEEKDISPELKNKIDGTDFLDTKKFKDFDCFIEKIREEEKNKNDDIEEYINDIKSLCLNFEEWFRNKIGRNRQ